MGVLGIYSVFSRNIRTTMLLILPGLVTRHSRHFIYTITLGMLMNGPVQSLTINFHKLLQNAGQTQRQSITKVITTDELKHAQCLSENDQNTAGKMENPELRGDFSKKPCQVVSDSKLFNFISKLSYVFIILSCHFRCEILRHINSCF